MESIPLPKHEIMCLPREYLVLQSWLDWAYGNAENITDKTRKSKLKKLFSKLGITVDFEKGGKKKGGK